MLSAVAVLLGSGLVLPAAPPQHIAVQISSNRIAFPGLLVADSAAISPQKAKIEAAKAAQNAKLGNRGAEAPAARENNGFGDLFESKDKKIADYDEKAAQLRDQIAVYTDSGK